MLWTGPNEHYNTFSGLGSWNTSIKPNHQLKTGVSTQYCSLLYLILSPEDFFEAIKWKRSEIETVKAESVDSSGWNIWFCCSGWPSCGTTPLCCLSLPWMAPTQPQDCWKPKLFCRESRSFTPTPRSSCSSMDEFKGWRCVQLQAQWLLVAKLTVFEQDEVKLIRTAASAEAPVSTAWDIYSPTSARYRLRHTFSVSDIDAFSSVPSATSTVLWPASMMH